LMTIRQYLSPIFSWWWLLIVAALTTGVTTYFATRPLPPVYVARATLLVGRGVSDPNPTGNDFSLSQQLASAYVGIATREPVQDAAKAALGLNQLPTYVAQANGAFVDISVTSSDPRLAQAVANELANQLILQSPANGQNNDPTRQAFINQQLNELQAQISQTKSDIAAKQQSLAGLTSAVDIANAQNDIAALNTKLTALETNYANLLANAEPGYANTISLFEAASTPTQPIGPNKPLILGLAIASGIVLAAGAAYLLEFLDNTLKTSDDMTRLIPFPLIGHIARMERVQGGGVYVANRPRSVVAEAFRSLRTNIEFASAERPIKSLMVTSANPGDGKTIVASNLAVTIARGGKKVILLDADLRKGGIHQVFKLSNSKGLSDVFSGSLSLLNAINPWQAEPNFGVIAVGPSLPNPTEWIGSRKMDDILARLQETADMVIIDAPPFLIADAWILAAKVDAVLLVVRPGHTRKEAVNAMLEQVKRVGIRLIGVTLNRIPRQSLGYYSPQLSPYYLQTERKIEWPAVAAKRASVKRTQASLELLNTISQLLANELNLHDQWKGILQLTVERMGASSGGLLVLDDQGAVVDGAVAYKGKIRTSVTAQLTQTAEQGLARWVIEHRQGALVPNTSQDPRWLQRSWEEESPSRSAISVPLITSQGVAGVLTLTQAQAGYFTDDDLALLTAVSSCISLSGLSVSKASSTDDSNFDTPADQAPQAPVKSNLAEVEQVAATKVE
jgi:capsular exopolysaccharide synthesis family protein